MDMDDREKLMGLVQLFLGFMGSLYVCIDVLEWGWVASTLASVVMAIPVGIVGYMVPALVIAGLGHTCVWAFENLDPSLRRERRAEQEILRQRSSSQITLRASVADELDRRFSETGHQALMVTVSSREDGSLRISPISNQSLSEDDLGFVRGLVGDHVVRLFGDNVAQVISERHLTGMDLWRPPSRRSPAA